MSATADADDSTPLSPPGSHATGTGSSLESLAPSLQPAVEFVPRPQHKKRTGSVTGPLGYSVRVHFDGFATGALSTAGSSPLGTSSASDRSYVVCGGAGSSPDRFSVDRPG